MDATDPYVFPSTYGHLRALFAHVDRGYVVTSYPEDRRWRSACWRPDQLDEAAAWCAARSTERHNVYVRTTTLAEPVPANKRGRTEQTGAVVALWADLDVAGPGHQPAPSGLPHPPDLDAARLLLADLDAVPSMTIHTGGGLHPWWFLEKPWYLDCPADIDEAKRFAERWSNTLVELGRRRGWHVDSVGDLTRVLRVSGTHRYKPNVTPNLVTIDACGIWPAHGVDDGPAWRPGPLYTVDQLEMVMAVGVRTHPGSSGATIGATRRLETPEPESKRFDSTSACTDKLPGTSARVRSRYGPADAINDACTWADILGPAGWTHVGNSTVDGSPVELWLRPGDPTSAFSAKCSPDGWAINWSSASGLPVGPGRRLNKWRVFCHLRHGGDESAAGREIRELSRRCFP
jgi:hypothetical protein